MTGLQIIQMWYDTIWVKGDLDAIALYLDQEAMASGFMSEFAAKIADFQALVPAVLNEIRNVSFTIDDSMEADDKTWAHVTLHAKKAEDMQEIHIPGQVMIRVQEGKIVEAHNAIDLVGYFEQMGNLPRDSVALMLAGEVFS